MENCLFCKIAQGLIPSSKIYEDELVYAFLDINPQAKKHALIIPKSHLSGLNDLDKANDLLLASLLRAAKTIASHLGIEDSGYRVVSNCGKDARQSVQHLHFHVLGGQELSEVMV